MAIQSLPLYSPNLAVLEELHERIYGKTQQQQEAIARYRRYLATFNPYLSEIDSIQFIFNKEGNALAHLVVAIHPEHKDIGIIGFFEAEDKTSAAALLKHACSHLQRKGCRKIRGPIDLSTWHSYRYISGIQKTKSMLDPLHLPWYAGTWANQGFREVAWFVSAVRTDFSYIIPFTKQGHDTALEAGFGIRQFDRKHATRELRILHGISSKIFTDSWNHSPISLSSFYFIYEPYLSFLQEQYLLFLEDSRRNPVGFCFALPEKGNPKRLILKTLGVLSEYRKQGLAAALLHAIHVRAQEDGFAECYYPFILEGNAVTKFPYEGYTMVSSYVAYERFADNNILS